MPNLNRRVLKWSVPVDDHDHPIGSGRVLHVETMHGNSAVVYVWTEEAGAEIGLTRARVYGTGQPIEPEAGRHVGSTVTPVGLVWHVYAKETE